MVSCALRKHELPHLQTSHIICCFSHDFRHAHSSCRDSTVFQARSQHQRTIHIAPDTLIKPLSPRLLRTCKTNKYSVSRKRTLLPIPIFLPLLFLHSHDPPHPSPSPPSPGLGDNPISWRRKHRRRSGPIDLFGSHQSGGSRPMTLHFSETHTEGENLSWKKGRKGDMGGREGKRRRGRGRFRIISEGRFLL